MSTAADVRLDTIVPDHLSDTKALDEEFQDFLREIEPEFLCGATLFGEQADHLEHELGEILFGISKPNYTTTGEEFPTIAEESPLALNGGQDLTIIEPSQAADSVFGPIVQACPLDHQDLTQRLASLSIDREHTLDRRASDGQSVIRLNGLELEQSSSCQYSAPIFLEIETIVAPTIGYLSVSFASVSETNGQASIQEVDQESQEIKMLKQPYHHCYILLTYFRKFRRKVQKDIKGNNRVDAEGCCAVRLVAEFTARFCFAWRKVLTVSSVHLPMTQSLAYTARAVV